MKTIALICPNSWDEVQLERSRPLWGDRYTIIPYGEDVEENPAAFDALAFIDAAVRELRRRPIDGVTSSSDYPGILVAAAIARELGLPGPDPAAALRCSHKYYSRLAQQAAVPEATPPFCLIDPDHLDEARLPLRFPFFVKPVKSWFSVFARRVDSLDDLRAFLAQPDVQAHLSAFVSPFNQLIARYGGFDLGGGYLVGEALLAGHQVTVEGYVYRGTVESIGIVDSVMFPGTISFQRFEYPSSLDASVQQRMARIAARAVQSTGFDDGLFNVELFYDQEADRIWIIEINPRMCGQFADLYEAVHGTNTYEILLALAAGEQPPTGAGAGRRRGRYGVAASFPLRVFTDKRVVRVPSPDDVAAVKRDFSVSLVKAYYRPGDRLSAGDQGDGASWRYGMVNLAAPDRPSLLSTFEIVRRRLGFKLEDV